MSRIIKRFIKIFVQLHNQNRRTAAKKDRRSLPKRRSLVCKSFFAAASHAHRRRKALMPLPCHAVPAAHAVQKYCCSALWQWEWNFLRCLHSTLYHLMGYGTGKQDHQIRRTDLLFDGSGFFREHLCRTAVRHTHIGILAAHTLVSSDNHNAHWIISPHKVPGLLRHTPQPVDISGSQADPRHQELCVSRLVSHVPHSWGSLLLQELALTNYRIAYI